MTRGVLFQDMARNPVCVLFQDNTFLTHLDFSYNHVGSKGVLYIARGLKENQHIAHIVSPNQSRLPGLNFLSFHFSWPCLPACLSACLSVSLSVSLPTLSLIHI